MQEQGKKLSSEHREDQRAEHGNDHGKPELDPKDVLNAHVIPLAVKLRAEQTRRGRTADRREVEDQQKLVCDGDARHLVRADLPDHNVVQKTDEIRDPVLEHDRQHDSKHHFVERPVPYEPPDTLHV